MMLVEGGITNLLASKAAVLHRYRSHSRSEYRHNIECLREMGAVPNHRLECNRFLLMGSMRYNSYYFQAHLRNSMDLMENLEKLALNPRQCMAAWHSFPCRYLCSGYNNSMHYHQFYRSGCSKPPTYRTSE